MEPSQLQQTTQKTFQMGLTSLEVAKRIEQGDVNESIQNGKHSIKDIILHNVFTYFNFINVVLACLVFLTGQYQHALFFFTVLFNTCMGIFHEIHAKRILDRLQILINDKVMVLRDQKWTEINREEIVKDDYLHIQVGMQVPSDCRIVRGDVEVNEAILTGESNALHKTEGDLLLAGSILLSGEADVIAVAVGKENYAEKILKDAKKYQPAISQLKKDLERFLRLISIVIVPVGILLFLSQYLQMQLPWQEAIIRTVSGLVGMIPEGLVVLTSVAMVVSVIKLAQKEVLVQDLSSVEVLARVDVLCLDKTGTITTGNMKVTKIVPFHNRTMDEINHIMGNYIHASKGENLTDVALKSYFTEKEDLTVVQELPFSSARKYAAVSFEGQGTYYVGAANFLFPNDTQMEKEIEPFTNEGYRTLLVAHTKETQIPHDVIGDHLEAVALIIIEDEIRENAKETFAYFKQQGVSIKVISGDDAKTVSNIAKKVGVDQAEKYIDLSKVEEESYPTVLEEYTVFGRVLPEQKKIMLEVLQKNGHTVAMVGDGVNDVLALKQADIGIAMENGAQAAKNSANIILLQSDLQRLPSVLWEGRRVIHNISRGASMYLVKTFFSILLMCYVLFFQETYPFVPLQLTFLSALGVGIPTFFLQFEANKEKIKGRFLTNAMANALPSSITVFLCFVLLRILSSRIGLSAIHFQGLLMCITGFVYFYTLLRVYKPMTKYRLFLIVLMAVLFVVGFYFLRPILGVQIAIHQYWILGVLCLIAIVLIMLLRKCISLFQF